MDLPHALHRASPAELKARIAAERRQRPFILYRDADGAQRLVDLGDAPGKMTVGRTAANGVALEWDSEVSRVHATLERIGDEWTFVDDGRSHNGSFIDGVRVHGRRRLRDGDTIAIGRTVIVFRSPTGSESVATATSQQQALPVITDAQRRVLVELCRPYADGSLAAPASNREIADTLVIGVETVKTHVRALFEAFALRDLPPHQKRAVLARRALDAGLVSARDLTA
jgi:hypothetical protein